MNHSHRNKQLARNQQWRRRQEKCGFSGPPKHFCHKSMFVAWSMALYANLCVAGIKPAVSYSPDLLIDPLLLLRRLMPLCTSLCRRGAPPRDPVSFIIFLSVLCHISPYHLMLLFMLPSICLLSSLSCSLSCLLLSLYRFIPLYTDHHASFFLFFWVLVLHAQSLA